MRRFARLAALFAVAAASFNAAAQIPANLLSLRPVKGMSYQPSPSDDCQLQNEYCSVNNAVYYDTDFYNTDFPLLWGSGTGGRGDLATLKAQGINFLHIYNWNPQRDHGTFLTAVAQNAMKVTIPVSNYTACIIVGNQCQGVANGSYATAYANIKAIFEQVYNLTTKKPHSAAGVWAIYNEYDLNSIDPANIAFAIQAILKLEADNAIAAADRLPFIVPVSNAVNTATSASWFQNATSLYQAIPGANASVPPGVVAIIALSVALQNAQANNITTYTTPGQTPVTVGAVPANFWSTRFIATVNPFTTGPTLNAYITQASQFQSAFPGAAVTAAGITWGATWNTLPPLFFTEMGINIGGSGGTTATQASYLLSQIQCTNPWAVDGSTPQGYFLGSTVFEFEYEGVNGHWGMWTFPSPLSYTTGSTTSGQTYRIDNLTSQLAWTSVSTGYSTTSKTSCQ